MDDGDYRKVFKLKKTLEEAITGCNEDTDCGCVHYSQITLLRTTICAKELKQKILNHSALRLG